MPTRISRISGPVRRLACLADVHGNTAALDAVIASSEFAAADAVAFLGCMTTGPDPSGVIERSVRIDKPVFYLTGNGERAILEMADQKRSREWPTGRWILDHHRSQDIAAIRSWPAQLVVDVIDVGTVRLCHGSPRSDIELLTPRTTPARISAATQDVAENIVIHGHTHLQYQRSVDQKRIVGAGSVGLPYRTGAFGAYWTLLGPQIEPVYTPYEIGEAVENVRDIGYPGAFLSTLMNPPSPEQIMADAESRQFSD